MTSLWRRTILYIRMPTRRKSTMPAAMTPPMRAAGTGLREGESLITGFAGTGAGGAGTVQFSASGRSSTQVANPFAMDSRARHFPVAGHHPQSDSTLHSMQLPFEPQ
eukprot:Amastigsp_a1207_476.p4 type:complete len:107 gc:universal Amastigsp_a1207_476:1310-990(-)